MKKLIYILIAIISFVGCGDNTGNVPIVGGECQYDSYDGVATLVKNEDGYMNATYAFEPKVPFTGKLEYLNNHQFNGTPPKQIQISQKYPANLKVITKGTCTPWFIEIKEK